MIADLFSGPDETDFSSGQNETYMETIHLVQMQSRASTRTLLWLARHGRPKTQLAWMAVYLTSRLERGYQITLQVQWPSLFHTRTDLVTYPCPATVGAEVKL